MFVIAVAAAEAAVGLAIVVSLFRARNSADIDDLGLLRD
jgi:NADH-quinone oxidoreductase subunit K